MINETTRKRMYEIGFKDGCRKGYLLAIEDMEVFVNNEMLKFSNLIDTDKVKTNNLRKELRSQLVLICDKLRKLKK